MDCQCAGYEILTSAFCGCVVVEEHDGEHFQHSPCAFNFLKKTSTKSILLSCKPGASGPIGLYHANHCTTDTLDHDPRMMHFTYWDTFPLAMCVLFTTRNILAGQQVFFEDALLSAVDDLE